MAGSTMLSDKEVILKLVDLDAKYEGDDMTRFEIGFLDTITRYNKQNVFCLSSGQREQGLRILEKYDWL